MRVYVTGGTGFIGSYVAAAAAKAGDEIVILARNPKKARAMASLKNVRVVKANMYDNNALKKHLKKPDALIHVALCWGDTGPDMIKNETLNSVSLIDLAVRRGVKKVIYTSSTACMGNLQKDVTESDRRHPSDFYGATKGSVELFLNAYARYHKNIRFNTVRPGYTFGNPVVPGGDMEPDKRFRDICGRAAKGKDITVIKHDGTQFIWAGDLARVYMSVLRSGLTDEVFFGLSRTFTTWQKIAEWAVTYAGSKSKIKLKDLGWGKRPRLYKVDKIRKYFGLSFNPAKQLKEHVKYLVDSYR